jgi:hypothetical protein
MSKARKGGRTEGEGEPGGSDRRLKHCNEHLFRLCRHGGNWKEGRKEGKKEGRKEWNGKKRGGFEWQ